MTLVFLLGLGSERDLVPHHVASFDAVLHARLVRGWGGKHIALMSIIGLTCVLFTYLGVNYLPDLHTYPDN